MTEPRTTTGTAIFDLDKTVTRKGTWSRFVRYAVGSDLAFWPKLPALGLQAAAYKLGMASRDSVKERAIALYLAGHDKADLEALAADFVTNDVAAGLRTRARRTIDAHKARGDTLIIASAAVDLICQPMAEALGFDDIICTRLSWDEQNRLLPTLDGPNCYGAEKLRRIIAHFETHPLTRPVTFYTDHITDLPLLNWADKAVAVNPHPPLRALAGKQGIEVTNWDS